MPTGDAVTLWLTQLQAGESSAARLLWEKYFHQLVGLARHRLRSTPRRGTDEEDVALSAFDSFCRNAQAGRFPNLTDRDSLWQLLATFILRKAAHHARDETTMKRGGATPANGSSVLDEILGREPDPALAVEMAEECERLLAALDDQELRQVALLRMDGYSVEEVATKIRCSPRSVKRMLQLIRAIWEREIDHERD